MVTLSIVASLYLAAAPSFSEWTQNTRIRTAADSIQNGLALARSEAVHRNTATQFVSCGGAFGEPSWDVLAASATATTNVCNGSTATAGWERVQMRPPQGGQNAVVATTQTTIGFNGLARQASTTDLASATATPSPPVAVDVNVSSPLNGASCKCPAGTCNYPADITYASTGKLRCLRISVSPGGQVRMCDPALSSGPQKC